MLKCGGDAAAALAAASSWQQTYLRPKLHPVQRLWGAEGRLQSGLLVGMRKEWMRVVNASIT
jgi:hypothetical protein